MIAIRLIPQPGVPIADQVVFAAKKAIFGGKLLPGEAFPSVRVLAREMKIHANTAQKVIAALVAEGLLEVRPGIGTVVAPPKPPRGGRAKLLARDVEHLTVQAMQLGVPLPDLLSTVEQCWRDLAGEDGQ